MLSFLDFCSRLLGALLSTETDGVKLIWNIADTINGFMAVPNLIGLLGLSLVVRRATQAYKPN